jgi:hypothetical protein
MSIWCPAHDFCIWYTSHIIDLNYMRVILCSEYCHVSDIKYYATKNVSSNVTLIHINVLIYIFEYFENYKCLL